MTKNDTKIKGAENVEAGVCVKMSNLSRFGQSVVLTFPPAVELGSERNEGSTTRYHHGGDVANPEERIGC
jgi:hypothetical protein